MKATVPRHVRPGRCLDLRDIDRPAVGDDDVLVRVPAAAGDPGSWGLGTGSARFSPSCTWRFSAARDEADHVRNSQEAQL